MFFCGCIANHTRTGEVGLLTKRQFQIVSAAYHSNDSGMNPFAIVAPFEEIGAGLVGLTYAPCIDILSLPYDLYLKLTGDKICVLDDHGMPVVDADIELNGSDDALIMSNGSHALHDEVRGRTGKCGMFRTCRRLKSIPNAYCRISKRGYYDTYCRMERVLNVESGLAHAVLKPVRSPIPLFVRQFADPASDSVGSDLFAKGNGSLELDLLKGDWLPPVGSGEYADVVFTRLPREDLGMGTNAIGITASAYRDTMSVMFTGEGNGLVEVACPHGAGIKIREAPNDGYRQTYVCWKGRGKDLLRSSHFDKRRNFAFRIRTERDEKGKITSAYYGKIYGDIDFKKLIGVNVEAVAAPSFCYYLNPTPNDRNLEWDMKTNLCAKPGKIGREP